VHILAYHPEQLMKDPWALLEVWGGIRRWAVFLGGMLAVVVFFTHQAPAGAPYADRIAIALTGAWYSGRLGCSLAHDHPGLRSTFFWP